MVFSSTVFLFLFFPILLLVYYLPVRNYNNNVIYRNTVLIIFSILFYAYGEPVFVFLMLFSALITWLIGLTIDRFKRYAKFWLILGVSYLVGILIIFKYASFFINSILKVFGQDIIAINIALPIGISFLTFQMISYLVDVYRGTVKVQNKLYLLVLYISLFPQLIAGPIVRYKDVSQSLSSRKTDFNGICEGIRRFVYGLSKKVLVANYMAMIADNIFDYDIDYSVLSVWIGALAYTLQIYYDFSGYSDMAIGLGKIFGFDFPENFTYPYCATSVTDFWRRWHISLGSWFRDYVYIPLGGNRVKKIRWLCNILTVWLLTGLWHGASWTFVIWGGVYGVVLLIEKTYIDFGKVSLGRRLLGRIYTMTIVVLAWVIFRAPTVEQAWKLYSCMFGMNGTILVDNGALEMVKTTWFIWIVAIIGAAPMNKHIIKYKIGKIIEPIWIIVLFIISVTKTVGSTYNPFIYFNF